VDEFQFFRRFHRLVKLAVLLKPHAIFTESCVSRMRESGDFVKICPPSARRLPARSRNFAVLVYLCGIFGAYPMR
jgi:hypothetical protein